MEGLDETIALLIEVMNRVPFIETFSSCGGQTQLRFEGCEERLEYRVANVGRSVCGFDGGLIEGFLRNLTADMSISVKEIACLGRGDTFCEFHIEKEADKIGNQPIAVAPQAGATGK